jgi:phenylpyruvate tautomerase PptA (4-oxalocrotonate tautomerase family)
MPHVRIEVVEGRTPAERKQLLQAVHEALVEAFQIPDDDRTQAVVEHDRDAFERPPGTSDRYTLIEVTAFPGRSIDPKRALYRAIVANLGALGVSDEEISIVLHEPPMENWGIRGGRSADAVDLGFKLDV